MELYLVFFCFFFPEFTISKNLISPLSTKKSTYRKRRTQKNFAVLTLLPKIDIIRLTKTSQIKRTARDPAIQLLSQLPYNAN